MPSIFPAYLSTNNELALVTVVSLSSRKEFVSGIFLELPGRMEQLTCLGSGTSELSMACAKQVPGEEESPQKQPHVDFKYLRTQESVSRETLFWGPGALASYPIFTITFLCGLI